MMCCNVFIMKSGGAVCCRVFSIRSASSAVWMSGRDYKIGRQPATFQLLPQLPSQLSNLPPFSFPLWPFFIDQCQPDNIRETLYSSSTHISLSFTSSLSPSISPPPLNKNPAIRVLITHWQPLGYIWHPLRAAEMAYNYITPTIHNQLGRYIFTYIPFSLLSRRRE